MSKASEILNGMEEAKFIDEVGKFWVVTKATLHSELADIVFQTDLVGFGRQFLGGLRSEELVGVFLKENNAKKLAQKILSERGK